MADICKIDTAVILAGGLGTRLGHLTRTCPKALVEVTGRPFLEHKLQLLADNAINKILLLVGHLGSQIEEALGDGSRFGVCLDYSFESQPLGTGGALRNARKKLPEQFFLTYGDSFLNFDYQLAADKFCKLSDTADGLMCVVPARSLPGTPEPGNVKLDAVLDRAVEYTKGANYEYLDAGVLILKRDVIDMLADGASALESLVYPALCKEGRMLAFVTEGKICHDIGTPERLELLEQFLLERSIKPAGNAD